MTWLLQLGFDASEQKAEILMIEEFSAPPLASNYVCWGSPSRIQSFHLKLRVRSAVDQYLRYAAEDLDALEDVERYRMQAPRPPPLRVIRRPLPVMTLGQGHLM